MNVGKIENRIEMITVPMIPMEEGGGGGIETKGTRSIRILKLSRILLISYKKKPE